MSKIVICGDVFDNGNIIFSEKIKELLKDSYNVINLEAPFKDNNLKPINKLGPNLNQSNDLIFKLNTINVNMCNLGNNHILDYGKQGFDFTIKLLNNNKIKTFGYQSGHLRFNFIKVPIGAKSVGIFSYSDYEFNFHRDYGASIFDYHIVMQDFKEHKDEVDYIIVLYHGGKERSEIPSANLQRLCRYFVDNGANLVICQHSHTIGVIEKYNGSEICYGQGNFATSLQSSQKNDKSIIYEISIEKEEITQKKYLVKNINNLINIEEEYKDSLDSNLIDFNNKVLLNSKFLSQIKKDKEYYLNSILGFGKIRRRIFKKKNGAIFNILYKKRMIQLLNLIRSDTLRDVIIQLLQEFEEKYYGK